MFTRHEPDRRHRRPAAAPARPHRRRAPWSSSACGGSTASTPSAAASRRPRRRRRPAGAGLGRRRATPATPAPRRRSATRSGATRRDQEPAGDRRRVPRRQPEDHGQGRPCPTGTPTGTSSRPASPAATRPTSSRWTARSSPTTRPRDVLLDLKPFIDRDGYDLGQLADQAVADFTTPDGQFGLPRDLNVIALYYNKTMFDAAEHPVPGRHVGLGEARRGRQEADAQGRRRQDRASGASTPRPRDMENYWSVARLAERRRHHLGRPQDEPRRQRPGGRRHPVPPGPDLEGQGHARRGDHRRARRRVRAGPGGDGGERLVARRDPPGRRHRLRDRAAAEGPGRPGDLDQPDRRRRLQGHEEPGRGLGVREVPRQPGGPDQAHGAARRRCRRTRRSSPDRSRRRSTAPRSSPTRSPTPTSSRRSRATTTGRPRSRRSSTRTSSTTPNKTVRAGDRPTSCRSSTRSSRASDGRARPDRRPR